MIKRKRNTKRIILKIHSMNFYKRGTGMSECYNYLEGARKSLGEVYSNISNSKIMAAWKEGKVATNRSPSISTRLPSNLVYLCFNGRATILANYI